MFNEKVDRLFAFAQRALDGHISKTPLRARTATVYSPVSGSINVELDRGFWAPRWAR
ncbi:MAG: hypothetical protein R2911_39360 [Caldilineaceae bacterium]